MGVLAAAEAVAVRVRRPYLLLLIFEGRIWGSTSPTSCRRRIRRLSEEEAGPLLLLGVV